MLQSSLTLSFDEFTPDVLYYNAGTDCMAGDPLGRMDLSPQGIITRDEIVFKECLNRNIPIVMVLSGGYQKTNGPCIADSITNLNSKLNIFNLTLGKLKERIESKIVKIDHNQM